MSSARRPFTKTVSFPTHDHVAGDPDDPLGQVEVARVRIGCDQAAETPSRVDDDQPLPVRVADVVGEALGKTTDRCRPGSWAHCLPRVHRRPVPGGPSAEDREADHEHDDSRDRYHTALLRLGATCVHDRPRDRAVHALPRDQVDDERHRDGEAAASRTVIATPNSSRAGVAASRPSAVLLISSLIGSVIPPAYP